MLNLLRSARNRLRPVWITFGIVLSVFPNTKKVPYKFFNIVQFSRSCAPQPFGWRPVYFTTEVVFCQVLFSKLLNFSELGSLWSSSEQTGTFQRLLVLLKGFVLRLQKSFFCLSAWRSSIIPHSVSFCKSFFKVFRVFSCFGILPSFRTVLFICFDICRSAAALWAAFI